jgi:hypothetical protein
MNNVKAFGTGVLVGAFIYNCFMIFNYGETPTQAKHNLKSHFLNNSKPIVEYKEIKTHSLEGDVIRKYEQDTTYFLIPAKEFDLH